MDAGEADRLIVIERRSQPGTQGSTGAVTFAWSAFATVWAKRHPKGGRKFFAAQQINAEIQELFEIRYVAGLDRAMRINFESQIYEIASLDEIGRHEGWLIGAKVPRA